MKRSKLEVRNGYILFFKQWPSNWETAPMIIDGTQYNCVEQFMMAEKARTFEDTETRNEILATLDPKAHRALGRKVKGYDGSVWDQVRYEIVLRGTKAKYLQNPDLLALLLDTGEAIFVECNPFDRIWGIGLSEKSPDAADPTKWMGQNLLGRVITQAREEIRKGV